MPPLSIFDPVDPAAVSVRYLKQRTRLLFAAMKRGEIPDMPVAPGWFRCFTCRRELEKDRTEEEALADYRRRFGGTPRNPFTVCDDCNRIIAAALGVPLLCPRCPQSHGPVPPGPARHGPCLPACRPG